MIDIFNVNCIHYMQVIKKESFDLLLTDPPYKTITGGDRNGANSIRPSGILSGNRKLFRLQNQLKPEDWMSLAYQSLKNNSHAYIFTNSLNLETMIHTAKSVGFKLHNVLVWEKNNCTPSQFYMKNCEYVLFLGKGKAKYINNIGGSKTVHFFENIKGKKLHPTQKPVELLEFYILNSTNPGDIVFDPFVGSGSTAIACMNTGRNFAGTELDKDYYDLAKKRVKEYQKISL